eukprot:250855_1
MKTENIVFLCTKVLRDMKIKESNNIDLIKMKEILVINKIDGFSFNAEIKNANDFIKLFVLISNNNNQIWEELYYELVSWKLDENTRKQHEDHQKKYKNKLYNNETIIERKDSYNEITMFGDITRVSIRNDIDYEDSMEKNEWIEYRHNLKNIFRFFAGWNSSYMKKKELQNFLDILDIKKFWTMHLLQDDIISMDQFIKYLCNEYINNRTRDIKKHIIKQPQYTLLLNALKFLEDIDLDNNNNKKGILQFNDFKKFGKNLSLNDLETEILFNKIDKNDTGNITIDQVFEWFKKKLLQKHNNKNNNNNKCIKKKRKITRRSKSDDLQEID